MSAWVDKPYQKPHSFHRWQAAKDLSFIFWSFWEVQSLKHSAPNPKQDKWSYFPGLWESHQADWFFQSLAGRFVHSDTSFSQKMLIREILWRVQEAKCVAHNEISWSFRLQRFNEIFEMSFFALGTVLLKIIFSCLLIYAGLFSFWGAGIIASWETELLWWFNILPTDTCFLSALDHRFLSPRSSLFLARFLLGCSQGTRTLERQGLVNLDKRDTLAKCRPYIL